MADTPMTTSSDDSQPEMVDDSKDAHQPYVVLQNGVNGKIELTEMDAYGELGFNFTVFKKWSILSVIFVVQCSMNFNASVYGNVADALVERFRITGQMSRVGQAVFLIAYGFGCELWAPWSEEFGRRTVLQLSLAFVNIFQLPCALATNYNTIIIGRLFGGLSSAGGSVTLGMVADMWEPDDQQYAVAFIVLSSVGGSVLGPVLGGFIQKYQSWQWIFWWQLIFGLATQALHFFFVPETRATNLLDREAKRRRAAGEANIHGPNEMKTRRITAKEVMMIWYRPFEMFVREPIVLFLSLLSGFSDALIFTFLESYSPVFKQWHFGTIQLGLAFVPLLVGYVIAYFSFFPFFRRHNEIRKKNPHALAPEARLYWLLWTAPLETIGLFGFAATSLGPPQTHWIAPLLFSALIAMANVSSPIACAVSSKQIYTDVPAFGRLQLVLPTIILACLAFLVTIPIFVFYWKGPAIRARSKFAQSLACDRKAHEERRRSAIASAASSRAPSITGVENKDA
ncbi:MAG: hypothetical protein Q9183_002585 [Haloplaca sp. 2 TL-2023]